MCHRYTSKMKYACGYSVFELVAVIVLVGILAAYVGPRINFSSFQSTGFVQQSVASIRFAQKLAISSGCSVEVEINNTDAEICELKWSGCAGNVNIPNPASGNPDFCADSKPVGAIPSVNFTYDRIGSPSSPQSITVDGRTILVEANTGFVHE